MSFFHRHEWEDVHFEHSWFYDTYERREGSTSWEWDSKSVYETECPGAREIILHGATINYQHPIPHTTITQKCKTCKDYRSQTVVGIVGKANILVKGEK